MACVEISIAMYPAICGYDEQALINMSEESGKKKKLYHEIAVACSKTRHGWAGQKMAASDKSKVVTQDTP